MSLDNFGSVLDIIIGSPMTLDENVYNFIVISIMYGLHNNAWQNYLGLFIKKSFASRATESRFVYLYTVIQIFKFHYEI